MQNEVFRRQRRNVMLVSLVLFFYQTSGVVLEKINILGNQIKLTDPSKIIIILWLIWGYFLWRYIIYFLTVNEKFSEFFYKYMDEFSKKVGVKLLEKEINKNESFPVKPPYSFEKPNLSSISIQAKGCRLYKIRILSLTVENKQTGEQHTIRDRSVDISGFSLFYPIIRSFLYVVFFSRWFTDYCLPFLLAALPVVYFVIKVVMKV